MNAVGKLGNYISRGVVTVSAPFHPFGSAVDIVVVEQRDGSFKSSPWYVQFGKFQGVLKAREKVVSINFNGVDADFCMYLDNRGGAHFVREVDGDEGMSESISSSNDTDASSVIQMPRKITGCHYEFEPSNHKKKKMTRSNSTGHRVLGFVFGRRSWKEKRLQRDMEASLERAEFAADLLEVRWSTSLAIRKHRKDNNLRGSEFNGFHDKDDPELPLSTSPVNYMESFTLKETYLDFDVYESSVGSNGGDSGSNSNSGKSDVGGMSSGDEQSITFQALQGGDERRMERVESSIYCDSSESFTDKLDGSSGESSENLCHVPAGLRGDKVNSELSSSILASEVGMNREDLEDKDPCISIDGSKSDSVTASDGETVLQTNVNVVVECKSNESHVNYVEEMAVNQIPSNEEPSLTNTYFTEEVTSTILDSRENMRSQKLSSPASTDLLHMGSCENNDSLLASMNESNRDAFMSSDSVREESNSQYFAESSEVKVGLLTKKPSETQFLFSDLDRSELTKTRDTQPIASDSLEAENDPHQCLKSSEEKLHEFTAMLNESHSFTGQETLPYDHSGSPKSASVKKKMLWEKTPTSEQLASLNLKEGRNEVTFTFSNPMLGEQKVNARIYLWNWNARIVISDVDGTITKSDVLGQFMPLVGVDWSQTGVAHLFSAIKENGYELLFLSARAISQASLTRHFLFNLKQDGKALPEGPVVISPDGLFPSLIREVIRRAPHEFKIACLEAIRALFPPDHNPFYAGFGNRDTDELSYLKVGIPKGKIFIINPRGEVAVQRLVDRKSYASLYTLVHNMFPPPSSVSSSEQEDFNSWNFWRLPPPEIVV